MNFFSLCIMNSISYAMSWILAQFMLVRKNSVFSLGIQYQICMPFIIIIMVIIAYYMLTNIFEKEKYNYKSSLILFNNSLKPTFTYLYTLLFLHSRYLKKSIRHLTFRSCGGIKKKNRWLVVHQTTLSLLALPTKCLYIRHDGNLLGMNDTPVCVFKQSD